MSTGKMGKNGGGETIDRRALAAKSRRCRDGVRLFRYGRHARGCGDDLQTQRRRRRPSKSSSVLGPGSGRRRAGRS